MSIVEMTDAEKAEAAVAYIKHCVLPAAREAANQGDVEGLLEALRNVAMILVEDFPS